MVNYHQAKIPKKISQAVFQIGTCVCTDQIGQLMDKILVHFTLFNLWHPIIIM